MPLSIATPMAGTWEQAMPPMILAIGATLGFAHVAIAVGAAAAIQHHPGVRILWHTAHHARDVLERQAVAKRNLDGVVNVAAHFEHPQPIALEHRAPLLGGERKAIQVTRLVGLEGAAVLRTIERHAEHV